MPDETLVHDWLDRLELLRKEKPGLTIDEFIAGQCQGAPADLVAAFRSRAQVLESVDGRLGLLDQSGEAATGNDTPDTGNAPSTPAELRPGQEPVPGYRLEALLGKGGFGQVWRATAPGGLPVALKFVPLHEWIIRESERRALDIIKRVRHPHLLATVASWQQGGYLIIAMELADRTLLDRFREAVRQGEPGIPARELLGYMTEAAKALDFLNEARHPTEDGSLVAVQHRDIKPQNLLLMGGSLKVGDFGLARVLQRDQTSHTGPKTLAYAAPEFFAGTTSSQSDQYSLAVTYCHLRGGRLPFGGNDYEITLGHLDLRPDLTMLPLAEQAVVGRALAKLPKDRWPSCQAFVEELRRTQETGAEAETDPRRLRELLFMDLTNIALRRRYLAVRTPELLDLDLARGRGLSFTDLCKGLFAITNVLGFALARNQFSEIMRNVAGGVVVLITFVLLYPLYWKVEDYYLDRKMLKELGPLPADAPKNLERARQIFLGE